MVGWLESGLSISQEEEEVGRGWGREKGVGGDPISPIQSASHDKCHGHNLSKRRDIEYVVRTCDTPPILKRQEWELFGECMADFEN